MSQFLNVLPKQTSKITNVHMILLVVKISSN